MTSRDSRGLIQIPDKNFFNLRKSELLICKGCNKTKNIPKINNGLCNLCLNKLFYE